MFLRVWRKFCRNNTNEKFGVTFNLAITVSLLLFAANPSLADGEENTSQDAVSLQCDELTSELSASERFVLDAVCDGKTANLQELDGDYSYCLPFREPGRDLRGRELSGAFFTALLTNAKLIGELPTKSLEIECFYIDDFLNLSFQRIIPSIYLRGAVFGSDIVLFSSVIDGRVMIDESQFQEDLNLSSVKSDSSIVVSESLALKSINLIGARVAGNLNFQGVRGYPEIQAAGLRIGGSFYFRSGSTARNIDIADSIVAGNIEFVDSTIDDGIDATSASSGGSFFIRNGVTVGGLTRLVGLDVGANLEFVDSNFRGYVQASPVRVGNSLLARGGAEFSDLALRGSDIRGSVEFGQSKVTGVLDLRSAIIASDVDLDEGAELNDVLAGEAKIGGSVHLSGARISGLLDFSGSQIDSRLSLFDLREGTPTWTDQSRLNLRAANVRSLESSSGSWKTEDEGFLEMALDGFEYDYLLAPPGQNTHFATQEDEWLEEWLVSASSGTGQFNPQVYDELSETLDDMGFPEVSSKITYWKYDRQLDYLPIYSYERVFLTISKYLVGYGVYPFQLLPWFATLVTLGIFAAFFSAALRLSTFSDKFWFSIENSIPLVELDQRYSEMRHDNGFVSAFFHLQKLTGFLMATILIGAISVLG